MKRDRRATLLNDEVLSRVLRGIKPLVPPSKLSTSLRVLASKGLAAGRGRAWLDRLQLFADNLARPLALTARGRCLYHCNFIQHVGNPDLSRARGTRLRRPHRSHDRSHS